MKVGHFFGDCNRDTTITRFNYFNSGSQIVSKKIFLNKFVYDNLS